MGVPKSFFREKRTLCSQFMYVEVYKVFDIKQRGRKEKKQKSSLKQQNANDKNARKAFIQLVQTNFGVGDLVAHLTYDRESLPDTIEAAEKNIKNYIRRLEYARKKKGLPKMKYIVVSEYQTKEDGTPTRFHHHVIMDGQMDRDTVESLWRMRRKKGEAQGRPYGFANCDKLQPNEFGLEALARYLTKGLTVKKRWHPSQNLKKPTVKKNDYKWSERNVIKMAGLTDDFATWRKIYPGYRVVRGTSKHNDKTNAWAITLTLRREYAHDDFHDSGHAAGAERIR